MIPFSVDTFLDRTPSKDYNCLDFVRDVWLALCGEDIAQYYPRFQSAISLRQSIHTGHSRFKRIAAPISPCFVVFQLKHHSPHIGIYIDGLVLHLYTTGVEYQPLNVAKRYFKRVRFYQ